MQTFYLQFKIRPKSFSVSQFSNTAGKLHLHKLKVAEISLETTIVFFSFLKSRMLSINLEAKALETKDLWENYIFPNLKKQSIYSCFACLYAVTCVECFHNSKANYFIYQRNVVQLRPLKLILKQN